MILRKNRCQSFSELHVAPDGRQIPLDTLFEEALHIVRDAGGRATVEDVNCTFFTSTTEIEPKLLLWLNVEILPKRLPTLFESGL